MSAPQDIPAPADTFGQTPGSPKARATRSRAATMSALSPPTVPMADSGNIATSPVLSMLGYSPRYSFASQYSPPPSTADSDEILTPASSPRNFSIAIHEHPEDVDHDNEEFDAFVNEYSDLGFPDFTKLARSATMNGTGNAVPNNRRSSWHCARPLSSSVPVSASVSMGPRRTTPPNDSSTSNESTVGQGLGIFRRLSISGSKPRPLFGHKPSLSTGAGPVSPTTATSPTLPVPPLPPVEQERQSRPVEKKKPSPRKLSPMGQRMMTAHYH